MPAKSKAQQALMAIALHQPGKLKKKNRGLLKMSAEQLKEFASTPTKKLPSKKNSLLAVTKGDAGTAKKVAAKKGGK